VDDVATQLEISVEPCRVVLAMDSLDRIKHLLAARLLSNAGKQQGREYIVQVVTDFRNAATRLLMRYLHLNEKKSHQSCKDEFETAAVMLCENINRLGISC
jgi:hypothetical protein